MAAAQYLHVPGYSALILREHFTDLDQADALIPRSKDWWSGKAHWNPQGRRWTFPSGATITFGYLDRDDAVYQYQSAAYQFIAFDELTQHSEFRYRYMFSRLRRPSDGPLSLVPLRMRAATNPGGRGHAWVKARFIDPRRRVPGAVFVPAKLEDNPSLDRDEYLKGLSQLDPLTRSRLLRGDWDASAEGRFKQHWFGRWERFGWKRPGDAWLLTNAGGRREPFLRSDCSIFASVDPAASEKQAADYTVIGVLSHTPANDYLVLDVVRDRFGVEQIVPAMLEVSARWYPEFFVFEDNGFQVAVVRQAQRTPGLPPVIPAREKGKGKVVRATPAINRAFCGQVFLPHENDAAWVSDFADELTQFTGDDDAHDDQVDMLAQGVLEGEHRGPPGNNSLNSDVEPDHSATRPAPESSAARMGLFGRR